MMIRDFKEMLANNPELHNSRVDGEDVYMEKWKKLDKKVSPLSYRIYSPFIGRSANILPPDVSRVYIEPILNPGDTEKFYNDKNSFGLIYDKNDMPLVYFRSMSYRFFDGDYNAVLREDFLKCFDGVNKLVVKPAKDLGGHGIEFFERNSDNIFVSLDGNILSLEYLERIFETDFLIQECFVQSDALSRFNPTSVNTIRVITYRNVETGEIHVLGAVLRIGFKGAVVDNATAGGGFIGINGDGKLGHYVFDKYARKTSLFNGKDFLKEEYIIPNYKQVKQFAVKVSKRIPHMGLFAHDIALDKFNTPKLIEVNTRCFTDYFLQLTHTPVFDKYTDSLIKYCIAHKDKIGLSIIETCK
ncbi:MULTISPECIES: sugar-transfer associated ATP-grasp domain-containing protein [Butyricimonas]|uniref:sugar-transfer associated ATP-grasp domain-containing protein n=1 Tax=Butyricimonas TaxID=574697 RepID=UPI001D09400C|nr:MULTISPECIES: sugar-transfer associated ATP-grasp domain-containing protein [Butyricimonas]MCB6974650.1 hypothetical protein [Butyricimonas synergistica]MCG4521392.1 hypothetical protein [Butyricimonas sp. DFI.6.44]